MEVLLLARTRCRGGIDDAYVLLTRIAEETLVTTSPALQLIPERARNEPPERKIIRSGQRSGAQ
jgi:hypothetical protein